MICTEVTRNKEEVITSIFISGHSGYDEIGKDIVCSAVSTAMYISIGLLEKFNIDYKFTSDDSKPIMKLDIIQITDLTKVVLDNLVETLHGIAIDYSQYLKIKENRR